MLPQQMKASGGKLRTGEGGGGAADASPAGAWFQTLLFVEYLKEPRLTSRLSAVAQPTIYSGRGSRPCPFILPRSWVYKLFLPTDSTERSLTFDFSQQDCFSMLYMSTFSIKDAESSSFFPLCPFSPSEREKLIPNHMLGACVTPVRTFCHLRNRREVPIL